MGGTGKHWRALHTIVESSRRPPTLARTYGGPSWLVHPKPQLGVRARPEDHWLAVV